MTLEEMPVVTLSDADKVERQIFIKVAYGDGQVFILDRAQVESSLAFREALDRAGRWLGRSVS